MGGLSVSWTTEYILAECSERRTPRNAATLRAAAFGIDALRGNWLGHELGRPVVLGQCSRRVFGRELGRNSRTES